jgi:hypothetical protein
MTSRIIHSGLLPDLRNALDDLQTLGVLELLLLADVSVAHLLAELFDKLGNVDLLAAVP